MSKADDARGRAQRASHEDEIAPLEPGLSLVGQTLHERYSVERELGAGSLGRVYLARDRGRGGEAIALKVVRADRISEEALGYLRAEFQNLARLKHPNVAAVFDLDRLPGREELFFTEEFCDGPDIVTATRGKDPKELVALLVQSLRALAYVHARGLLHADVKPKNVFVVAGEDGKPRVKIVDFHLARELSGHFDRSLRGTIAYMAPEVVRGERPDARADLYSLGVVAYEALAGELPFAGRSAIEVLRAHASESVVPLRAKGARVPPALEAVVLRLLEKKPDARFKTANDVIRALNAGLGRRDAVETAETRESYILSPRFVGREKELAAIVAAVRAIKDPFAKPAAPAPSKKKSEGVLLSFDGLEGMDASVPEELARPDSEDDPDELVPRGPSSEARVFVAKGESGVGKSRLLREVRVLSQVEGLPVHEVAGEPGGRPYGPFLSLLEAVLRREGEHALRERILGADGRPDAALVAALEAPAPHGESPRALRLRTTSAIGSLLLSRSRARPFVALVESAEELDEGSVELVRFLAAEGARGLAVFVLAARDDGEGSSLDALGRLPAGRELVLDRLGPKATAELLASMVAAESVPDEVVRRVHEATGGNPRFVAETLRSLAEAHALATRDGVLSLGPEAAAHLQAPRGVVEVAARRVARLDEDERLLLGAFAASSRPRPLVFAARVAGLARERAERAVGELVKRGLLDATLPAIAPPDADADVESWSDEVRVRPVATYFVEASPVRKAALEALPAGREEAFHLAAARLLESRHPSAVGPDREVPSGDAEDAPRDRAEELSFHLARAGAPARAFRYAFEAGEAARQRFEPARAARLYQRALELAETASESEGAVSPGQVALARVRLGEARFALGDRRAAALALAEAADDVQAPPRVVALARRLDAVLKKSLGAYERAERALDRAARAARIAVEEGDPEGACELARARAERASIRLWRGDYARALVEGKEALAALREQRLDEEVAPVCQTLYHAAHFSGDEAAARAFLKEGLDAGVALEAPAHGDDRTRARAALEALSAEREGPGALGDSGGAHVPLTAVGAALDRAGQASDLEQMYERKIDLLEATRDVEGAALAHNNLANLRRLAGRYDLAVRGYRRALSLHRALGGRPGVALARLNLARAVAELGDPRGAESRALRARSAARACGARWIEAQADLAIADCARRRGDLAAARTALARGDEIVRAIGNVPLTAEAALQRAEVELDAQEAARAEDALDAFERAPPSATTAFAVARGRTLRARILVARARLASGEERERLLERASSLAEQALEVAKGLKVPELTWRAARARAAARIARGQKPSALEDLVLAMETLRKVAQALPRDLRALYLQDPARLEVREAFKALGG